MIDVMEFRKQMRVKDTTPVAPQWMLNILQYTYRAFSPSAVPNSQQNLLKVTYRAFPVSAVPNSSRNLLKVLYRTYPALPLRSSVRPPIIQ
jgi:hypothetical protein